MGSKAVYWDNFYQNTEDEKVPWNGGRVRLLNSVLSDLKIDKNSNILEIGCGKGDNVFVLNEMGYKADGIDVSDVAVQRAKNRADEKGIEVNFYVVNVTESSDSPLVVGKKYDLVFDLVTSQFFSGEEKGNYLKRLVMNIVVGGQFVLYTYAKDDENDQLEGTRPWIREVAQTPESVQNIYGKYFEILKRQRQTPPSGEKLDIYYMKLL